MKLKKLSLLLFLTAISLSCKDETKKPESGAEVQAEEVATNSFKVILNAVVKENDDFCLLYTEDGSLDFKDGIWKAVKGAENEQEIEFYLPKDVFPTQLRLDLGKNENQGDILIKSIKFDYLGNVREIKGFEIGVFFRADASNCTYDSATGAVKALMKDGKREIPSLYPNESVFAAELPKLAK